MRASAGNVGRGREERVIKVKIKRGRPTRVLPKRLTKERMMGKMKNMQRGKELPQLFVIKRQMNGDGKVKIIQ